MLNGAVKVVMEKVNQNQIQNKLQQQRTNKNHSETSTKEDWKRNKTIYAIKKILIQETKIKIYYWNT